MTNSAWQSSSSALRTDPPKVRLGGKTLARTNICRTCLHKATEQAFFQVQILLALFPKEWKRKDEETVEKMGKTEKTEKPFGEFDGKHVILQ